MCHKRFVCMCLHACLAMQLAQSGSDSWLAVARSDPSSLPDTIKALVPPGDEQLQLLLQHRAQLGAAPLLAGGLQERPRWDLNPGPQDAEESGGSGSPGGEAAAAVVLQRLRESLHVDDILQIYDTFRWVIGEVGCSGGSWIVPGASMGLG